MKSSLVILLLVLLSNTLDLTFCKNSVTSSSISENKSTAETSTQDEKALWAKIFEGDRATFCRKFQNLRAIKETIKNEIVQGERNMNTKFYWVKKWGFGPASYLFDFLDPVFKADVLKEFKKSYEDINSAFKKADMDIYADTFDLKKLDPTGKLTEKDFKNLTPNYVKSVYDSSVNSVQLFQALRNWGWFSLEGHDSAREMILNYDLNGDGRLSPREYILAVIMHHKNRDVLCYNCFSLVKKRLQAVFNYFDCTNKGYLTAEEIWNRLPRLMRPDKRWNIFSYENSENIRTNAVNDFVIKNSISRAGGLTRDEFVSGVLLGIWDRQTSDNEIIEDDSRNLKVLRWKDGGMVDTVAFEYIKEAELSKIMARKEEQKMKNRRAAYDEAEKRRNALQAFGY